MIIKLVINLYLSQKKKFKQINSPFYSLKKQQMDILDILKNIIASFIIEFDYVEIYILVFLIIYN